MQEVSVLGHSKSGQLLDAALAHGSVIPLKLFASIQPVASQFTTVIVETLVVKDSPDTLII